MGARGRARRSRASVAPVALLARSLRLVAAIDDPGGHRFREGAPIR